MEKHSRGSDSGRSPPWQLDLDLDMGGPEDEGNEEGERFYEPERCGSDVPLTFLGKWDLRENWMGGQNTEYRSTSVGQWGGPTFPFSNKLQILSTII